MTDIPPAERLRQLEDLKLRVRQDFARLDRALGDGRLTLSEYRYYLREVYQGADEREILDAIRQEETRLRAGIESARQAPVRGVTTVIAVTILLTLFGLGAALLLNSGPGLTGYVTSPVAMTLPFSHTVTDNATVPLNVTSLSGLRVSGVLVNGSGSIWLESESGRLLVWQGSAASSPAVWTPFTSYALNESVNVTVIPASASFTLWLTAPDGSKQLVAPGFITTEPGSYTLDALLNASGNITKVSTTLTVRNETNTSNDEPREPLLPSTAFTDACAETCTLNTTGNLSLLVETNGQLTIDTLTLTTPTANNPPVNTKPIPDLTLTIGETTILNLDEYFTDPDNDTLTYDFIQTSNAAFTITGNTLTITATNPGSEQSILYASDTNTITQSNLYTITVNGTRNVTTNSTTTNVTTNATNNTTNTTTYGTHNTTIPPSNITAITISNTTNSTTPDCSNPDPNKRPIECLQQASAKFFPEQEIYIMTTERKPTARITPIGNLLIKGDVAEHATFDARPSDYRIGYEDDYGNYRTTIWFDSESGNLYLAGALHEENENNIPTPGSFVLRNKRGITLAWANPTRGDLYLRGNLIPYRRTIEVN